VSSDSLSSHLSKLKEEGFYILNKKREKEKISKEKKKNR
jgi:hypothetical protein